MHTASQAALATTSTLPRIAAKTSHPGPSSNPNPRQHDGVPLSSKYDTAGAQILGKGAFGVVQTCKRVGTGEVFALKTITVGMLTLEEVEALQARHHRAPALHLLCIRSAHALHTLCTRSAPVSHPLCARALRSTPVRRRRTRSTSCASSITRRSFGQLAESAVFVQAASASSDGSVVRHDSNPGPTPTQARLQPWPESNPGPNPTLAQL